MVEPNEVDNYWARQWSWIPRGLDSGVELLLESAHPLRRHGWIVDGSSFYVNCSGFRARMRFRLSQHHVDGHLPSFPGCRDYDLSVYDDSSSPTAGFTPSIYVSGSYRGALATDTFLFNSWQYLGYPIPLDYGITNYAGGIPERTGITFRR